MKRDRANDSALACVKVGHRQTHTHSKPRRNTLRGFVRVRTAHHHATTKISTQTPRRGLQRKHPANPSLPLTQAQFDALVLGLPWQQLGGDGAIRMI